MRIIKKENNIDLIVAFRLFGRTSLIHFALLGRKRKYVKIKDDSKIDRETNLGRRGTTFNNKMFDRLLSGVLASHRGGSGLIPRPGHVSLGTSSLGRMKMTLVQDSSYYH
jgi:hypothetical protein